MRAGLDTNTLITDGLAYFTEAIAIAEVGLAVADWAKKPNAGICKSCRDRS